MAKYRLSNMAKDDLIRNYQYGLKKFGEEQAEKYFDSFFKYFKIIVERPYSFESVDFIKPGYRPCVCGSDPIYYKVNEGTVDIMTIIGRQDLGNQLKNFLKNNYFNTAYISKNNFSTIKIHHPKSIKLMSQKTETDDLIYSILKQVSSTSISVNDFAFTEEQTKNNWIGNSPASIENITQVEKQLNIILPDDYKNFLKISNGFHASNSVEPSFVSVNEIDYLKNIDPELINIWIETGNTEIEIELKNSIVIGGIHEEQYFLLIQPTEKQKRWRYWKFASWIPGEEEYPDFINYWKSVISFNQEQLNSTKGQ